MMPLLLWVLLPAEGPSASELPRLVACWMTSIPWLPPLVGHWWVLISWRLCRACLTNVVVGSGAARLWRAWPCMHWQA